MLLAHGRTARHYHLIKRRQERLQIFEAATQNAPQWRRRSASLE